MASLEMVLDQTHGTWEPTTHRAPAACAKANCERCGAAAKVNILKDYAQGSRLVSRLCLSCADRQLDDLLASTDSTSWLSPTTGLIGGLFAAMMARFIY